MELPGEASESDADAYRAAAAALSRLLREGGSPDAAPALLRALHDELQRAARRGGGGCARACKCTWALCAAADGAPLDAAVATVAAALTLLLGAAADTSAAGGAGDAPTCYAGCACLLVTQQPRGALGLVGSAAGASAAAAGGGGVGGLLGALYAYVRSPSEPLCRMAGRALCALCSEPAAAATLVSGPAPPLLAILHSLPATLAAPPLLADGPLGALHAALAACIREAARHAGGGSADAAVEPALHALLAYADGRWSAVERALASTAAAAAEGSGAPHSASGLLIHAKEAASVLRLYRQVGTQLGGRRMLSRLRRRRGGFERPPPALPACPPPPAPLPTRS